jgi:RND family efflux transporter MFP subunit
MNMEKIKKQGKLIITVIIILVLAGAFFYGRFGYTNNLSRLPYAFVRAQKGDFVRELKLNGTVKADEEIKLSFERSGKVDKVNFKAGDKVKAGQNIAELVKTDASADYLSAVAAWQMAKAQVAQTEAALNMQNIKKQDILKGAKNEDVNLSETQLTDAKINLANVKAKAQADLDSLYAKLNNSLNDSYNKAHDALFLQTNVMFYDAESVNPRLTFLTPLNSQSGREAESERLKAGPALKDLDTDIKSLSPDYANNAEVLAKAEINLEIIKNFLDSLNSALSNTSANNVFTPATISLYQSNVSGAISGINNSLAALEGLNQAIILQNKVNENAIFSAQSQVDQAQSQLALKKSGATQEQVAIQDASIKQAQAGLAAQKAQLTAASANLAKAKAQLDKTSLKSPIDGVMKSIDLDIGEAISPNVSVAVILSAGKFQVETFVPELYIGEIKVGDRAAVSFDAYGTDRIFDAKIISIDPSVKDGEGAPVYRALLEFDKEDEAIKSGLTANVKIIIAEEKNVLTIPETSVIRDGDKSFVIIDNSTKTGEKREVTAGKSGRGQILILSGLQEGEQVADFGSAVN